MLEPTRRTRQPWQEKFGKLSGVVSCAGGQTMGTGLTVDKKGHLTHFMRLKKGLMRFNKLHYILRTSRCGDVCRCLVFWMVWFHLLNWSVRIHRLPDRSDVLLSRRSCDVCDVHRSQINQGVAPDNWSTFYKQKVQFQDAQRH